MKDENEPVRMKWDPQKQLLAWYNVYVDCSYQQDWRAHILMKVSDQNP